MTKQDFDGIESGAVIRFEYRAIHKGETYKVVFLGTVNTNTETPFFLPGNSDDIIDIDLALIESLTVLTGKLAPWSSQYVPDDADWCIQWTDKGTIAFSIIEPRDLRSDRGQVIVTRRPGWRLKNE